MRNSPRPCRILIPFYVIANINGALTDMQPTTPTPALAHLASTGINVFEQMSKLYFDAPEIVASNTKGVVDQACDNLLLEARGAVENAEQIRADATAAAKAM